MSASVQNEVRELEELEQAGVDTEELSPPKSTRSVFLTILKRSLLFLVLLGPALLGTVTQSTSFTACRRKNPASMNSSSPSGSGAVAA